MATVVAMSARGRLTLPADVRRQLGVEGEARFQVEVSDGNVVLRPVVALSREDAWAYTPEHRALLERAHADSRAGRVRQMSGDELIRLAERA
jgi:bifunctional DNA-binding transcriptional regulator/antitoxin component of YhaV-PrlF toxin-antitoxin module